MSTRNESLRLHSNKVWIGFLRGRCLRKFDIHGICWLQTKLGDKNAPNVAQWPVYQITGTCCTQINTICLICMVEQHILLIFSSLRDKVRAILEATFTHSRNLAVFVFLYKSLTNLMEHFQEEKSQIHSFVAAFIGGYFVFGKNNKVNEQVCFHMFLLFTWTEKFSFMLCGIIWYFWCEITTLKITKLFISHIQKHLFIPNYLPC